MLPGDALVLQDHAAGGVQPEGALLPGLDGEGVHHRGPLVHQYFRPAGLLRLRRRPRGGRRIGRPASIRRRAAAGAVAAVVLLVVVALHQPRARARGPGGVVPRGDPRQRGDHRLVQLQFHEGPPARLHLLLQQRQRPHEAFVGERDAAPRLAELQGLREGEAVAAHDVRDEEGGGPAHPRAAVHQHPLLLLAALLQEGEALLEELRDVLALHVREGEAQLGGARGHLEVLRVVVDGEHRLDAQVLQEGVVLRLLPAPQVRERRQYLRRVVFAAPAS
mmetsp:Transcript_39459/g.85888  ORF Transcript_39459/g.85888 Transcript_39459/m.85888 type:complete len:277 (-) Transcript_39459:404-1234(-)